MPPIDRVEFIGFGEPGGLLGTALASRGLRVAMFDRLLDDPAASTAAAMRDKATRAGVHAAATVADAIADTSLIVSAVTATSDVDVANAVARCIAPGQTFLDINSVSPATK